ncbi:transglutaminase family protein [Pseudoduganella lutea]|uniref:Transglutaminase family protein n=1 Tax=Pseudoduganella lutea TaxID=321985 RepID=A0A4P6L3Y8_9BURK|nr:transglutaminase family protein [Pseudoduganella lutea]QBE66249.1 transglutaminase family protein [Pseudoduganella lutea]
MQLSIRHETRYTYTEPLAYSIQQLHLTPRIESQQRALHWKLLAPGHLNAYTDAYGNLSHMLTLDQGHGALSIVAEGVVETSVPWQGRIAANDSLSPLIYTVPTRLTAATPDITALAAACLPGSRAGTRELMKLAEHIFGAVQYQSGATEVTTAASDALTLGRGVCQDHAHIFLACCHAQGIPARYVSGYIDPEDTGHAASHAWVDAWVSDPGYEGWLSIDVTHARLMTDAYCRIAVGRDYEAAAPVRGVRHGGGKEALDVEVRIIQQ